MNLSVVLSGAVGLIVGFFFGWLLSPSIEPVDTDDECQEDKTKKE